MKNIKDYILHLDNWIPENICKKTIEELSDNNIWQIHTYADNKTFISKSKNGNKELDICYGNDITYSKDIHELTWKALEKYIVIEKLGGEAFYGWKGFSQIRFNRYNKNQIMSKHCDHIQSLFTGEKRGIPILSILSVLNDDYEGGEFGFFDKKLKIKVNKGDVVMFPSTFMYPHQILPVTKGTRYSIITWFR